MRVARTPQELIADYSKSVGFVPTMGALHEGHVALMKKSIKRCDQTVVSIFVNPKQFGPNEDYQKYPRNEEKDLEICERAGVDFVFIPDATTVYPDPNIVVSAGEASKRWEGENRPGHFDGVVTVVAILFNIVRPNVAFFGQKDFQQCAVIRQLVRGLHFGIELDFVETVREHDGLALSSRNAYLSPQDRDVAPLLYQTLCNIGQELNSNTLDIHSIEHLLQKNRSSLTEAGFTVDYLALVDEHSLEPVSSSKGAARLIVAAKLGKTRLIDNIAVFS